MNWWYIEFECNFYKIYNLFNGGPDINVPVGVFMAQVWLVNFNGICEFRGCGLTGVGNSLSSKCEHSATMLRCTAAIALIVYLSCSSLFFFFLFFIFCRYESYHSSIECWIDKWCTVLDDFIVMSLICWWR